MAFGDISRALPENALIAVRNTIIGMSIVGILVGLIALIWPGITLLVIAVLFAISLFVIGAFRLSTSPSRARTCRARGAWCTVCSA